mmetsp:Transcript_10952/g.27327  ORF Transcript_10952/g.27327 Transcript_10952/m.27327 type:complete len:292 (+) Transcript_10952:1110-1985(+)
MTGVAHPSSAESPTPILPASSSTRRTAVAVASLPISETWPTRGSTRSAVLAATPSSCVCATRPRRMSGPRIAAYGASIHGRSGWCLTMTTSPCSRQRPSTSTSERKPWLPAPSTSETVPGAHGSLPRQVASGVEVAPSSFPAAPGMAVSTGGVASTVGADVHNSALKPGAPMPNLTSKRLLPSRPGESGGSALPSAAATMVRQKSLMIEPKAKREAAPMPGWFTRKSSISFVTQSPAVDHSSFASSARISRATLARSTLVVADHAGWASQSALRAAVIVSEHMLMRPKQWT